MHNYKIIDHFLNLIVHLPKLPFFYLHPLTVLYRILVSATNCEEEIITSEGVGDGTFTFTKTKVDNIIHIPCKAAEAETATDNTYEQVSR